jgi:hypothetical protein
MKMNNSNYENCYFNNNYETESAGIIQGATPSITGLSTTQMVLQANFSGFDFTDPWSICPQYAAPPLDGNGAANPVHGHSYPYFAWQQAIPPAIITQTNTASGNITLMFALIAPADSFGFTGMRDTNLYEEQTMWALCSSSECHPPYSPTMVMSFWTLQGTPDVGKYYSITAKYAGCQRQSTPAMWLSPQQPKHIVSLGNDTIEYGTILSAQQPINDIRPYITQGDTMVGDYVFYPLNNLSIPNYSIRYRYDALLPVGRYEKTMNDTTITVIDQNHQDAGKFYNLPPVVRSGFLKVIRAKGSIQVDMSHYPGYGPLNPHYTSNHADTAIDPNRVTFLYKRCEEDELHFTTAPPLLPGCYTIAAHLAESPNYTSAIGYLDDVQISSLKALEISISVDYGCIDTPRVVFNAGAPSPVIFKYKVRGSHSSTYTDTAPTQAGNYTLYGYVALYDADSIEYRLEDTINFIVKAKEPIPVFGIRQNNAVYGSPLPEPLVSINLSNSNVYFYYKPRGAHDSAYSSVPAVIKTTSNTLLEKIDTLIPVNSGSYTIRGITEETCRYIQDTAIYDFVITQARGIIRIEQDTGYWGYLPPPRIVQVNDTGRITYAYKNRGDSDAAYSALAPYEIGSYVIRAVMDSTNNHTADTFAVNFVIVKAYGRLVLRQDDGYFNSPLPMPIVLENNDNVEKNDTIRYMYKPADFPDSYFVEDIPTNAGWYVVRGVSKETQHYRAGLTDVLFEIVDTICTQKTAMLVLNYWEKLILVNINANTNGGKAFAQSGITYYWSRNALSLTGSANPPYSTSTLPYFYLNHFPQNGDRYLVWTNTINGEYVRACLHIGAIYTDAPLEQTQEHAWLYPNPINARVQTLTIESEDSVLPIEIYDIGGNKLREHAPTGWTTQISMDALPSGIYVVRHGRRAAVVTLRE